MNGPLFTDIGLSVMDVCLGEGLGLGLTAHWKLLVRMSNGLNVFGEHGHDNSHQSISVVFNIETYTVA